MDYRIKSRPKIPRNKYGYLTNTSTGNFSSDENNNIAGGGDKNLDMHKLWGNDFNGTQDVNGTIHFTDDAFIEFKDGSFHFSKGIWSDDFVSAFGQSSGGGGDGVYNFRDLNDIKDLNFGANDANKTIVWNGSNWVKSSIGGGGDTNVQSDWAEVDSNSDAYIKNKPALFSGNYNDLTNTPSFSDVAYSGSYDDLYDTPNFSTVATSGDYNDLINKITQTTISNWGFTKNIGTVTSVKVGSNGSTYTPSNGVVTIPAYPTLSSLGGVSTTTFNAHGHDGRYVDKLSIANDYVIYHKGDNSSAITVPYATSALNLKDYTNQTGARRIGIGFAGGSLTDNDVKYIAGYKSVSTNEVYLKDIPKSALTVGHATDATLLKNPSRDELSTVTINKTDNGGWLSYFLIADVTAWKGAEKAAPNYGFIGQVFESRTGGSSYLSESLTDIVCRVSYSDRPNATYLAERYLYTTSDTVIPRVIKYEKDANGNDKYWLALAITGSGRAFNLLGRFTNCLSEFRELKRVSSTSTTWFEGAEENRTKSGKTVSIIYDEYGIEKMHNKLQIGNALLSYDSSTNSLKVANMTSTTPMNFYATGGVSALGANGSTDNPQFNSVNVANGVTAASLTATTVNATNLKIGQYCQNISNIALTTESSGTYIYFNFGSSRYRFPITRTGNAT